jgi:serine/threonine protein kinase
MTLVIQDRLKSLVSTARCLSPANRDEFVSDIFREDPVLGKQLIRRLECFPPPKIPSTREHNTLTYLPTVEEMEHNKCSASIPTRIGSYTILKEIRRGGMGAVYLARQDHPKRDVALKVIGSTSVGNDLLNRFEAEYQVLARMSHNNIARIYEVGTTGEGIPFFTMEYVAGKPITHFCEDWDLSIRDRLDLFRQVCDGVLHAHQKAVIHRDLKPSNILVTLEDGKPTVKIIDFGIARDLDKVLSHETQLGALIGTPAYMSPEQLEVSSDKLDTRSDIYALGVVLYELITGVHPLDSERLKTMPFDEVLKIYRKEEPTWPSERVRRLGCSFPKVRTLELREDLDWLIMKAMAKETERRYATVADLKQDINRYLNDEPLEARPPGYFYRFSKFIKRNKLLVSVTLGMTIIIITALWMSLSSLKKANQARGEAHLAELRNQATLQKLQATNSLLTTMLSTPDLGKQGREISMRDILDQTETRLQTEFQRGDAIEAAMRITLGKAYSGLEIYDRAQDHFQRAREIRVLLLGEDDPDTLSVDFMLASVYMKIGDRKAVQMLETVMEKQSRILGLDHPQTLDSLGHLANMHRRLGNPARAEAEAHQVWIRQKRLLGDSHESTINSLATLAGSLADQEKLERAESCFEQLFALREQTFGLDHDQTLTAGVALASCLDQRNKTLKAAQVFERIVPRCRIIFGESDPRTLNAAMAYAQNLYQRKQWMEAGDLAEQVFDFHHRANLNPGNTLPPLVLMAEINRHQGNLNQAIALFEDALDTCRSFALQESAEFLQAQKGLGQLLLQKRHYARAASEFEELLLLQKRYYPGAKEDITRTCSLLAEAYHHLGRRDDAFFYQCLADEPVRHLGDS